MKVLITGGTGMVGKSVVKTLPKETWIVPLGSKVADLRNQEQTRRIIRVHKPDAIIHLAAKVGGVKNNMMHNADFYNDNIQINTNVLMAAHEYNVNNVVSLLSTCIFPDKKYVSYPLTEEQLHLGTPHETNFGYSFAKRMLEVQSRAFRAQYGRNYVCAIPNNIYGPEDLFDLEDSHVLPAIIRKIFEAKKENKSFVEFWGSGKPLRQFTYVDDIASCLIKMVLDEKYKNIELCNIGTSEEVSIKEVVDKVVNIFGYEGKIIWNTDKPEGQFRKPSKSNKIDHKYLSLDDGLKKTCKWFSDNYSNNTNRIRGINK